MDSVKQILVEGLNEAADLLEGVASQTMVCETLVEESGQMKGERFVENWAYSEDWQAPIRKEMMAAIIERGDLSTNVLFDMVRTEVFTHPGGICLNKSYQLIVPKHTNLVDIIAKFMDSAGIVNYGTAVCKDVAEVLLYKAGDLMGCGMFTITTDTNSIDTDILGIKLIASKDLSDAVDYAVSSCGYKAPRYLNVYKWDPAKKMMRIMHTAIDIQRIGHDCFYPFVQNGVQKLLKEYSESSVPVLLLIGPPGTGKSTFMRTMVCKGPFAKRKVSLVFGTAAKPETNFIDIFYDGGSEIMLLEDADEILLPRVEGNSMMADLLNNTSGVVGAKKKIVISTNLEDLSKVDRALLRGGRLFGIVSFRKLDSKEAEVVLETVGNKHDIVVNQEGWYTLSDLLEPTVTVDDLGVYKRQFGFNQRY